MRTIFFRNWPEALAILAAVLAAGTLASAQTEPSTPDPATDPATAASGATAAPDADWPVSTAPARFIVGPDKTEGQAKVSYVTIPMPDPRWLSMPVRFFTDTGTAVGSQLVWSAPGEPALFLYDSSLGAQEYRVYVGSNWPPMPLPDPKAGVWLETRGGPSVVPLTLHEMLQDWDESHEVLGRALLNGLFEGGNRFGPQTNLLLHFQGFFDVPAQQPYQFLVVSTDSSFALVDGKEVVEWPGQHGWGYGPNGPPTGTIDLAPGLHTVDYYNSYVPATDGNSAVMACLGVKGGPYPNWTMLTSGNPFFRPVTLSRSRGYQVKNENVAPGAPQLAPGTVADWKNMEQSVISTDDPRFGFVELQFFPLNPPGTFDRADWKFDDGTTDPSTIPEHLFLRPGLRHVRITLSKGGVTVASTEQLVNVHFDWSDVAKIPDLRPEQEAEIMARDFSTMPAPDLSSAFATLGFFQKSDDLLKMLPALCPKLKDVPDADLPRLKDAALTLIANDRDHSAQEEQLLQALMDRAAAAPPATPGIATARAACQLALARLTLKTTGQLDGVAALLAAINRSALDGNDPRLLDIAKADLALARGDVSGARAQYAALTGDPTGPDERSSIRRTAMIAQARSFTGRMDYDAAEDALNEVAWNSPIDKMAPDWALARLRLYQAEGLGDVAYIYARRLLPVIADEGRPELLYRLVDLALAHHDHDMAAKSLSELLEKHPYSEEAALAKQKWPNTP